MSKKVTREEFIERARKIHGDKYDYSKVEYANNRTKVCIVCPKHGEFWQTPHGHLHNGGCNKCGYEKMAKTISSNSEEFVERAKKVHGGKYDYSKVEYTKMHNKVCIICPKHGEFWQRASSHLNGCGCKKCQDEKLKIDNLLTIDEFILRASKIHNNKYDYSKVNYVNGNTKICIICPVHGEFWQKPYCHLRGQGCPSCSNSTLENNVMSFLLENKIDFNHRKKFKWLGQQHLDFYIPEYNVAIECQGEQHFRPVEIFGGENAFIHRQELDKKKCELCKSNHISLEYINYNENPKNKIEEIINKYASVHKVS